MFRPLPILLAALVIACTVIGDPEFRTPADAAPGAAATATAPHLAGDAFIAEDGARLPLRRWLPAGPVGAVVLALHGFGDYSHAFAMPAAIWAKQGIATYAYDQRGFGAAPTRGRWAGAARLAVDAIELCRLLRQAYPGRPLYLLGESMGSAVAVLAMTGAIDSEVAVSAAPPVAAGADGVILAAPAVWARETMGLLPRLALFVTVRLFPDMEVTGRGLHIQASDNIPMLEALARDPLILKEARVDTVYGLVDLMDGAFAAARRLTAPLLLLYGAHDEVIPRAPVAGFVAQLPREPASQRRLAYYREGYHLLLRDLEGPLVANDVASWIHDRRQALPSRADAATGQAPWPPPTAQPQAMPLAQAGARR